MLEENRGASASAIQHHYDVSNRFYSLWLDPTMTYSCALFNGDDRDLHQAQLRKIDYHIAESRAAGAGRLLDVGCGWGATMVRAVRHAGTSSATGLTLSEAQAEYVLAMGEPRLTVRVESWEHHHPEHPYDAIISVGAFEHFARPDMDEQAMTEAYARFFAACHRWLVRGGRLSLQTIAYGTAQRKDINRFVLEHIFPESDLPTLETIVRAAKGTFEIERVRNDREHYADTFREWSARLDARRAEAVAEVGTEVVEHYRRYHGLFTIGFHTGAMSLLRLTLRRLDTPSLPELTT